MSTTKESLFKQLLFLSKLMFTFLIVGLLIFINFLDLKENNSNRVSLNLLKDVYEKNNQRKLLFKDYELKRLDSLKTIDAAIYTKHFTSRVALVNTLNRFGAFITRASKGGDDNKNNKIVLMLNDSVKSNADVQDNVDIASATNDRMDFNSPGSVNNAIDVFNTFPTREKVILLTAIDTLVLKQKCDSIYVKIRNEKLAQLAERDTAENNAYTKPSSTALNSSGPIDTDITADPRNNVRPARANQADLFGSYKTFEGLYISGNKVTINFTERANANNNYANVQQTNGTGNQGTGVKKYAIEIPASTKVVTFPSTLVFAGYPNGIIEDLSNENKQEEIRNLYGSASLNMIDNISVDIYNKNNQPISILGFDLSRKWFPIALFIVYFMVSLILFNTVKRARSLSLPVIAESAGEDTLSFIISSKAIRFFLWVLTPPLLFTLVMYASFIHYNTFVFTLLVICCTSSSLLGLWSYKYSLKL